MPPASENRYALGMRSVVLQNNWLRLEVRPDVGGAVSDFAMRIGEQWQPLWRRGAGCDHSARSMACTVLAPWTHRIAGGKFEFAGRLWTVPASAPNGEAAMGIVKDLPWSLRDRGPDSVRLEREVGAGEAGWPWAFRARVRYELVKDELRAELELLSRSNGPMPMGFGFAPVWLRRLIADDDELDIDVGTGTPVRADAELDECTVNNARAGAIRWNKSRVVASWTCSPEFSHTIVRTPRAEDVPGGRSAASVIEVQPVAMAGAAAFSHADATRGVLRSGETARGVWWVRVRRE